MGMSLGRVSSHTTMITMLLNFLLKMDGKPVSNRTLANGPVALPIVCAFI